MNNRTQALKTIETMIAFQKQLTVPFDSKLEDFPGFKIHSLLTSSNRHPIFIADEISSKTQWFLKKAENKLTAARELIFQELLRLIVGETQPQTKIIFNSKGEIYIASQAIPDSTPMVNLPYVLIASEILEVDLVIFGQLYFLAETFEHDDASLRNALIDRHFIPRLVDGEHALGSLLDADPLTSPMLTTNDVMLFPFPADFKPEFGWLDQVQSTPDGTVHAKKPTAVCQKLHSSKEFQYGAYLAGLKIVNAMALIRPFIAGLLKANHLQIEHEDILLKRIEMQISNLIIKLPHNVVFNDKSCQERGVTDYKDFVSRLNSDKKFLSLLAQTETAKDSKKAVEPKKEYTNLKRLSLLRHKTIAPKGITLYPPALTALKRSITG